MWGHVRAGGGTPGTGTRSTGDVSLLGMQDLLRHRAEVGLEQLELGPLIGRGSYGRVYKGAPSAGLLLVSVP
jgi:hypothetical protein